MTRPTIDHSILSPSGRVSGAAAKAAQQRNAATLFPPGYWTPPEQTPEQAKAQKGYALLRAAATLRDLAARGIHPRKYLKEAMRLEAELEAL